MLRIITIAIDNFEPADWSGIDTDDTDFVFAPSVTQHTSQARSDVAEVARLREFPAFVIDFPEQGRVETAGVISNGPDSVIFLHEDDIVTTSYNTDGSATLSIQNRPSCTVDVEQYNRIYHGSQPLIKPQIAPTQILPMHPPTDDGDVELKVVG